MILCDNVLEYYKIQVYNIVIIKPRKILPQSIFNNNRKKINIIIVEKISRVTGIICSIFNNNKS